MLIHATGICQWGAGSDLLRMSKSRYWRSWDGYFPTAIKLSKIAYSNFCHTENNFCLFDNYIFDNFSDDGYHSMIRPSGQQSSPGEAYVLTNGTPSPGVPDLTKRWRAESLRECPHLTPLSQLPHDSYLLSFHFGMRNARYRNSSII